MSIVDYLSDLALWPLRGASAAVVLGLMYDPESQRAQRFVDVLYRAQRRAWLALELALAGTSWWQQVRTAQDETATDDLDQAIAIFFHAFPLPELVNKTHFRRLCLQELQQARRRGWLAAPPPEPRRLRQRVEALLHHPEQASEWQTIEGLAGELQRRGCGSVAWLLRQGTGTLLALFLRSFFRVAGRVRPRPPDWRPCARPSAARAGA
jgi:hypothetical protein